MLCAEIGAETEWRKYCKWTAHTETYSAYHTEHVLLDESYSDLTKSFHTNNTHDSAAV